MNSVRRFLLRHKLLAAIVAAVALVASLTPTTSVAAPAPLGQISEFSAGLNARSFPISIAPGADGNLWFTELSANKTLVTNG